MIGLKILTLTVVVTIIAAALQYGVVFRQPELGGKEVDVPLPRTSNNWHIKLWPWLFVLGGLLSPITARAASFDCSQAKRRLEVLICADAELSSLDGQVGEAYHAVRSTAPQGSDETSGLLSEQRQFLKNRTERCPIPANPVLSEADTSRMITCLKSAYTLWLNELEKRLAASGRQNAQTGPQGKAADIPSGLVATIRRAIQRGDFDNDPQDTECMERPLKEIVSASRFDLTDCDTSHNGHARTKPPPSNVNRPQEVWLVEGIDCLAAANQGPNLLYIRSGNGWRKILSDFAQDVSPRRACTHGLPDLEVWHHASASEGDEVVYQFDGNVYRETSCNHVLNETRTPCP